MCVRRTCCSIQIFSEHDEAAEASGAIAAGYTMMQPAAPLQHVMENRGPLHGTAVFVDTFHRVPWLPGGVFFLTHAHTDHMSGLGRSWRVGKLHCSRMTSAFLIARQMCVSDIIRAHDLDTQFDVEDRRPAARAPNAHWCVRRRRPLPRERHSSPEGTARRPCHFDGRLSFQQRSPPQFYVGWHSVSQSNVVFGRDVREPPPCLQ